jgi:hypothetical protein
LIGSDALKGELFDRLQHGNRGMHFSNSLEPVFFKQLASEHRVVHQKAGMPVRHFERISRGARAEALDALVYATASMIDVWKVLPFAERIARFKLDQVADASEPDEAWYKAESEKMLRQFPELRNDSEIARLLKEVDEMPDEAAANVIPETPAVYNPPDRSDKGGDGPRPRMILKPPADNPITGRPIGSWMNRK